MATDLATTLLADLKAFKGKQYVFGGLDCSGLVQQVYAQIGISLPRVSSQQWSSGVPVDLGSLQPGDLVFYAPGTSGAPAGLPGHVAIYIGNGQVFQALNPSTPIGTPAPVNQDWASPMGARRVIGVVGGGGAASSLAATGAPAPSTPQTSQTVATGSGSTCAFALGTQNKILVWNVNISICIISKTELRALLGALMMAGGGIITMVGTALVLRYALDKSGATSAIISSAAVVGKVIK